jgi:hypothetical protein
VSKAASPPPGRVREILKHFTEHPLTAESLEGLAGWRLLEEMVQRRVKETDEALRWLVSNEYLHRSARGAAPPMYRLNLDRRADAERLLGQSDRRQPRGRADKRR